MNNHPHMMHDSAILPAGILYAGHAYEPFGYHVQRPAGRHDWLLTWTHGGVGRYRLAGNEFGCRAGELLLLAPGTPHDYGTMGVDQPWQFYWTHFAPRAGWSGWLRLPELGSGLMALALAPASWPRLITVFERLLRDNGRRGAFDGELALNALEEVLILAAQQHDQRLARTLDPRVEAVLAQLADTGAPPQRTAELARLVALSPSRLSHLFKAEVGETIREVQLRLRVQQAARLLEFTGRSVGEVAAAVGFQSLFYFSRQFKAYYGLSPRAYRRTFE